MFAGVVSSLSIEQPEGTGLGFFLTNKTHKLFRRVQRVALLLTPPSAAQLTFSQASPAGCGLSRAFPLHCASRPSLVSCVCFAAGTGVSINYTIL